MEFELPGKLLTLPLTCVSNGSGVEPPNLSSGLNHGADWLQYWLPHTGDVRLPLKFGSTTSHMFCDAPPKVTPPKTRPPLPNRPAPEKSMPSQYSRLVDDVVSTKL